MFDFEVSFCLVFAVMGLLSAMGMPIRFNYCNTMDGVLQSNSVLTIAHSSLHRIRNGIVRRRSPRIHPPRLLPPRFRRKRNSRRHNTLTSRRGRPTSAGELRVRERTDGGRWESGRGLGLGWLGIVRIAMRRMRGMLLEGVRRR